MLPLFILIAFFVLLVAAALIADKFDLFHITFTTSVLAVFTAMFLLAIPLIRFGYEQDRVGYVAFKQTINNARKSNLSELERASILKDISEWNQRIDRAKNMNSLFFLDPLVPDDFCQFPHLE